MTLTEWRKGWEVLKSSGAYEYDLADLVIPGIAHCTRKDILIFNTSPHAHCPVYVVPASRLCNQTTNTDIPVCLAYDQAHYETLVPDTEEEILKTIALKNDILNGTYSVQMNDIPFLVKPPKHKSYAQIVKSPSQKSENSKRLRENEYKGPMQQNRRNTKDMKLTDSEIKDPKVQEAERKRNFRQNRSEEQIELEKIKQKIRMQRNREKKSDNEKEQDKMKQMVGKRRNREKKSENEKEQDKMKQMIGMRRNREKKSENEKEQVKTKQIIGMKRTRKNKSVKEKEQDKLNQKLAMKRNRENKSEKEKQKEKEKNKIEKQAKRAIITSKEKLEDNVNKQASNPLFEKAREAICNEDNYVYINIGNIFDQPVCEFCHAHRWPMESKTLCCNHGNILESVKPYKKPPVPLCELLQDKKFCQYIKEYNNAMAFASLGIEQNPESGPNFKILGKLHHKIGSMGCPTNEKPKFAQLYFYDQENEIQNRLEHQKKKLKPEIVKILQEMLRESNPYIKSLKSALDICTEDSNLRLVLHADAKLKPKKAHTRSFNLPLGSEVAVLLPGEQSGDLDVVLHTKGNKLQHINSVHRSYDPLHYVLILPFGQDGFQPKLRMSKKHHVSVNQFYAFHIQVRKDDFNIVLRCHKLSQQYMADMYAKVERARLTWVYLNQKTIKVEKYQGLIDAQDNGDINEAGKTVILPPTITGSPRWYVERYQDAMCIVRNEGKPDIFLTFTCNTNWPEIKESLHDGECAFDRPDICARVFKQKADLMVKDVVENGIFGRTVAHVFTIEWQKRKGLPHMHLLITLHSDYKIHDPKDIDKFISAEIPDPEKNPRLYETVLKHMMHGPCGKLFQSSPCMEFVGNTNKKICSKDYPKDFQIETEMSEFSYPLYRRRAPKDGGRTATKEIRGKKITIDNQWVIPYCPILLLKYDSHINVELVCSVVSVKYLYKYISKGPDRIIVKITEENRNIAKDEVAKFQDCRYLSASESAWKLLNHPIHGKSHAVMKLVCHLEHEQSVIFEEGAAVEALQAGEPDTHLTAWFQTNQIDENARSVLYPDFPKKYTWDKSQREWKIRKQKFNTLGRVPSVPFNIKTLELYSLRLLLHHVPGAVDYTALRTVNDTVLPSFQAACIELGLLENEAELDKAMEEAYLIQFGEQLRCLFCSILLYSTPSSSLAFWESHRDKLSEDWTKEHGKEKAINLVLKWLENRLALAGVKLKSLGLPEPENDVQGTKKDAILSEELNFDKEEQRILTNQILNLMNDEQNEFFKTVLDAINSSEGELFCLDAPGGTGKTFVLNALLSAVRSDGFVALGTAISAVASKLLVNGSTLHSKLKVPIQIKENSFCSFSKKDATGKLLLQTKLIIIDEVSMGHKHVYEAIDRTLRELTEIDKPFGNKTVVFAGDWRQCLPIIPKGGEGEIVNACLKYSYLWKYVKVFHLTEKMRVKMSGSEEAKEFSEFLLSIGDGTIGDLIKMPANMMTETDKIEELTDFVFPNLEINHRNPNWLSERAILCPTNTEADEINSWMSSKFQGEEKLFKSCDNTDDFNQEFQSEFLNTINLPGMPPHKLTLKTGMPVMLLRNLDQKNGHCNGVKYVILNMADHVIEVMAISGSNPGSKLFVPRITLISTSGTLPFTMRRKQFPIKPAFAMTANKAQGQTLARVGIYLGTDFFSHGQLYVALSRCGDRHSIKILKRKGRNEEKVVRNVVYRAVLNSMI